MERFTIRANNYLEQNIQAYYHQDYTTFGTPGNPDFLNHLKNQFGNTNTDLLQISMNELGVVLLNDLQEIKNIYRNTTLTVCVVPRAKNENYYSQNQRYFRAVVSFVVNRIKGYIDGTTYILRHTNTITTHMNRSGYGGDGDLPYPGITINTCNISNNIVDRNILLIDDIYTSGVNIDEDAIQALLDNGARNVYFYAVGKTFRGGW
ncbi:MAG: amidophosphoribosyltransferase [Leptospiraceae bacterium]|nr:amidophosphoribosyltransferase [Leptospiraceae bacterium]